MRYLALFLALFITLVMARPQLKQATRDEVIEGIKSPKKRQSGPSGGVYPLCSGSLPRSTPNGVLNAVARDVEANSGVTTNMIGTPTASTSGLDCAQQCFALAGCAVSRWQENANTCTFYNQRIQFNTQTPGFTSTFRSVSCANRATLAAETLICCDYITAT